MKNNWPIFCFLLFSSCLGEFINDPVDPRLPKYTETGNGVAGAYIDDEVWTCVYINDMSIINPMGTDSIIVLFNGNIGAENVSVRFELSESRVKEYEDLSNLDNQIYTLDGTIHSATVISRSVGTINSKGNGQFIIRKVRRTSDDFWVVAGTFGFVTTGNGENPAMVSSGRFDYVIRELFR